MIPHPFIHVATKKPDLEVADVFRDYFEEYRKQYSSSWEEMKAVNAIMKCRTALLGGILRICSDCGRWQYIWKACKNRNCPKCGAFEKAQWLARMARILLPIHYHQVVFTIDHLINDVAYHNQRTIFDLLFHSAAQVMKEFGRNYLGGEMGMTMALHTWGQTLQPHVHLHVMVTGGALVRTQQGWQWESSLPTFLFPVVELSARFRELFCRGLEKLVRKEELDLTYCRGPEGEPVDMATMIDQMRNKRWEVYIQKPPIAKRVETTSRSIETDALEDALEYGPLPAPQPEDLADPMQLANYLGRYVHQSAISNSRLTQIADGKVSFHYFDNRDLDDQGRGAEKEMTLSAVEFIRRFLWHLLPKGYVRIRHYGLHHPSMRTKLGIARFLLGLPTKVPPKSVLELGPWLQSIGAEDPNQCPFCRTGFMRKRQSFGPASRWGLIVLMILGITIQGVKQEADAFT